MEPFKLPCGSISITKPSFKIARATSRQINTPRWDRINSCQLIKDAREVYFNYVINNSSHLKPVGVVINLKKMSGKVVVKYPALLPDEQYLSLKSLGINQHKSNKDSSHMYQ